MARTLYNILGVQKTASLDEIRQAYRKLARKYHPDVNPGDKKAEEQFKKVAAAHEVLSDEDRRAAYDEFGEESLKGGFDPEKARAYKQWQDTRRDGARPFEESGQPFDLGDLFGFGGRGFRGGPMRGSDIRAMVDMDLRQAIVGGEVSVDIPGKGPVTVRIPPGADNGSVIRLAGKGAPGPGGGPRGDLVIETRVKPHPLVRRDGRNLHMKVPVTLNEAYNGASIEVPTFGGRVKLRVPPLSQPGTQLRLRGKGIERGGVRGDLLVELDVRLPDKGDEELAEAIRKSASRHSDPVRKEMRL